MLATSSIFALLIATFSCLGQTAAASAYPDKASSPGDWPTYLFQQKHSGYNKYETIINSNSAPNLKLHWTATAGGIISTQTATANGIIYWGSWDGFEHATNLDGTELWSTNLGTTSAPCFPGVTHGVLGTATVATVKVGKTRTPVVFVGGGQTTFYALNASSGAIIWQTQLGAPPDDEIWTSPAVYNGSVYIGIAHFFGECPSQGRVIQLNAATGTIQHTFYTAPSGCIGAGVWGSVTVDTSNGALFFGTGDAGTCSQSETYAVAVVQLRASDLSFISSWQIPADQQVKDSDFGSTPTLFTARFGGTVHHFVGLANKNGVYYALDEANIANGPVWSATIARGGSNAQAGFGSISPSAWDGTRLYVGGGKTTIGGNSCLGGLRALNPATGAFLWERCMVDGPVLGAVTAVPGVVAAGEGNSLLLVATSDGHDLLKVTDTNSNSAYYAGACISNGVLYIGNADGNLYAYGT